MVPLHPDKAGNELYLQSSSPSPLSHPVTMMPSHGQADAKAEHPLSHPSSSISSSSQATSTPHLNNENNLSALEVSNPFLASLVQPYRTVPRSFPPHPGMQSFVPVNPTSLPSPYLSSLGHLPGGTFLPAPHGSSIHYRKCISPGAYGVSPHTQPGTMPSGSYGASDGLLPPTYSLVPSHFASSPGNSSASHVMMGRKRAPVMTPLYQSASPSSSLLSGEENLQSPSCYYSHDTSCASQGGTVDPSTLRSPHSSSPHPRSPIVGQQSPLPFLRHPPSLPAADAAPSASMPNASDQSSHSMVSGKKSSVYTKTGQNELSSEEEDTEENGGERLENLHGNHETGNHMLMKHPMAHLDRKSSSPSLTLPYPLSSSQSLHMAQGSFPFSRDCDVSPSNLFSTVLNTKSSSSLDDPFDYTYPFSD